MYKKNLAIVVPCFNEGERLNIEVFSAFSKNNLGVTVFFVNDGSTDNTLEILKALSSYFENVSFINLEVNKGKANAVREGMLHALDLGFEKVGFLDADLSTDLEELIAMAKHVEDVPVVFGSRIKRMGAKIDRNGIRHYGGRIIATGIGIVTQLPVYDSQCGAKVFDATVVKSLFEQPFISKWLFDVEILLRYKNLYGEKAALEQIEEYPLKKWQEVGGSKIKLNDIIKVPYELFRIYRHYN